MAKTREYRTTRRRFGQGLLLTSLILPSQVLGRPFDDTALSNALRSHFEFSAGFREKFKTGTYRVPKGASDAALVDGALGRLKARLGALNTPTLALIHHLDGARHLHAWLIGSDGVLARHRTAEPYRPLSYLSAALRIDDRMATRAPVRRSGAPLDQTGNTGTEGVRYDAKTALSLAAAQLLGPDIAAVLAAHTGRLMILPASDTGTAPYAALPLAKGQRLIDRIAPLIVPDIETLLDPQRVFDPTDLRWDKSLVFGDPVLDYDPDYRFPPLRGARDEALAVGELLGIGQRQVRIGPRASLDTFVRQASRPASTEFIHIASHAISNQVNPMDGSFIGLSRGRLTGQLLRGGAFEFWGVRHPVVMLSGCQTALGKVFEGGTYGLSRAFFAAGAAQTVSSLWNVSDSATQLLMTRTVDRMFMTYPAELALQRAQRDAAVRFGDDFAAWASFTVFGMPSERGH